MIRFGLLHLFEDPGDRTEEEFYRENLELCEFADEVGLDSVWLAEHHFSDYGVMPSTQVFGSFIAARTKNIRIGTGVCVLPFHNPIRVAEEFAFLDALSGGRLDFGVGSGYQPAEFAGYGIPMSEKRERYTEALAIIRQAWTEDEVNFEGKHWTFKGIKPRPKPKQKPCPPIFGASFNPETIKFQAHQKLNLLFTPLLSPAEKIIEYRQILRDEGENPDEYRIGGLVFVYVHEDADKAFEEFEKPCMWYYRNFLNLIPAGKFPEGQEYYMELHENLKSFISAWESGAIPFRTLVEDSPFKHGFLIGTADMVREKLDGLLESYEGLTEILCWTRLGGLDHQKCMKSMELLVKDVVIPFRASRETVTS